MIQVTLDLENEHVLADNLKGLLSSLSPEQVQEVASKALFKYMTDTIDYDKERHIGESIAKSRKEGIKVSSNWDSKSADDLKDMSDDQIKALSGFREKYQKAYKSPRESRFKVLNTQIDAEVQKRALEFVTTNNDLKNLVTKKQEAIAGKFEEIVKETLLSVTTTLIFGTISNANSASHLFNQQQNIQDILQRNNLY